MNFPVYVTADVLTKSEVDYIKNILSYIPWEEARVRSDKSEGLNGRVDSDVRKTDIKVVPDRYLVDLSNKIINFVKKYDDMSDGLVVGEYQYLGYGKGSKFTRHVDNTPYRSGGAEKRVISIITLFKKSEDLEGGILKLYQGGKVYDVDLKVGQSVFFKSDMVHEVTEVLQGDREVLVTWLHKK